MIGLKLDFLTAGCRYDLHSRKGIAPTSTMRIDPLSEPAIEETPVSTEETVGSRDGE
jgi:hypothetical protein